MMNLILDLLNYLMGYCPLLMNVAILTLIVVLLADSIKKYSKYYYIFFGILAALTTFQLLNGMLNFTSFNVFKIPVLGKVLRSGYHMQGFGYPLLIIIMFVGALDPKNGAVKKVLRIRQELSLIAGYPVLCHSLRRVTANYIESFRFFSDRTAYVEQRDIVDRLTGLTLSNLGFQIGILLVVIFLVLWITSFSKVHRSLGNKKWKQIQKWSYVLYALLFVHSILLNVGWLLARMAGDVKPEVVTKGCITIATTVIIFATYLFLRLRKARKDSAKKVRN